MECKQKDLQDLEVTTSQRESSLGWGWVQPEGTLASDDDSSDDGARGAEETDMATTQVANDAPTVSAMPEHSTFPLSEEQTQPMEMEDGNALPPPASPVSHQEDELLMGGDAMCVEGEMANLKVSSPRCHEDSDGGASI